jgi:predicted tellurium resistance membrane protein TerC
LAAQYPFSAIQKVGFVDNLIALAKDPAAWLALATLIAMEVVLGVDNLIFVSILTNNVVESRRAIVRRIGLGVALIFRLALLGTIATIVKFIAPVFALFGHEFSWRDIILLAGGLFLVWKATREIHHNVEPSGDSEGDAKGKPIIGVASAIMQIILLDLVFSIDSIVTAVGMTDHIPIMVVAVVVAVGLMAVAVGPLSRFIARNPTIVMLALSFLLMIGMTLIADGFGVHVPKGYIYAAMIFSASVEALNMAARNRRSRPK